MEKLYTGLEPKNDNLATNNFGMRVHANHGAPMTREETKGPRGQFGGTYEQSLVPNPQNSDYTSRSVGGGNYKERMKSAEALDEMR